MENKRRIGLYIGRFQPFHKGHEHIVKKALKDCDHLIIAIGSANKAGTEGNPLSFESRKSIISNIINNKLKVSSKVTIVGVNDRDVVSNDSSWGTYLMESIKDSVNALPTVIYQGPDEVRKDWYDEVDLEVKQFNTRYKDISGTRVRKAICDKNNDDLAECLSLNYMHYLTIRDIRNVCLSQAERLVTWTRQYFEGVDYAVLGVSGGKDSSTCLAVLVKALGKDRVITVKLPNGEQKDIQDSIDIENHFDIPEENRRNTNIGPVFNAFIEASSVANKTNPLVTTNLPARLRMAELYNIAADVGNARVVNTCNRSEDYVGYATKFGDGAGDVGLLADLTVREVIEVGKELGVPKHLVEKTPDDGMCGRSDEDNLGFTYNTLDDYLLNGIEPDAETLANIQKRNKANLHKLEFMPFYKKYQ